MSAVVHASGRVSPLLYALLYGGILRDYSVGAVISLFIDIAAWVFVTIGALSAAQNVAMLTPGLDLKRRRSGRAKATMTESVAQRMGWRRLPLSLFVAVSGVCLLTIQSQDRTAEWLAAAVLTVVVVWDLGLWCKSGSRPDARSTSA